MRVSPRGRAWLAAGVWLLLIWTANSLPRKAYPATMGQTGGFDLGAHVFLYTPLGFLAMRALLEGRTGGWRRGLGLVLLTVACGAALGALDEWHKQFIPGRRGQVPDWGLGVLGLALGSLTALVLARPGQRREHDA